MCVGCQMPSIEDYFPELGDDHTQVKKHIKMTNEKWKMTKEQRQKTKDKRLKTKD